jgi:hypothetical protein
MDAPAQAVITLWVVRALELLGLVLVLGLVQMGLLTLTTELSIRRHERERRRLEGYSEELACCQEERERRQRKLTPG